MLPRRALLARETAAHGATQALANANGAELGALGVLVEEHRTHVADQDRDGVADPARQRLGEQGDDRVLSALSKFVLERLEGVVKASTGAQLGQGEDDLLGLRAIQLEWLDAWHVARELRWDICGLGRQLRQLLLHCVVSRVRHDAGRQRAPRLAVLALTSRVLGVLVLGRARTRLERTACGRSPWRLLTLAASLRGRRNRHSALRASEQLLRQREQLGRRGRDATGSIDELVACPPVSSSGAAKNSDVGEVPHLKRRRPLG